MEKILKMLCREQKLCALYINANDTKEADNTKTSFMQSLIKERQVGHETA